MYGNFLEGLSLRFVDGHGEGEQGREWRRQIWTGMVVSSASVFMLMRGIQMTFPTWPAAREDLGLDDGAG